MATMSTTDLLDVFKNMTVLELNDFLKAFEEEFGVTAAAPVQMVAAGLGVTLLPASAVPVEIKGDSSLVINQINGTWKAKDPRMAALRNRALLLLNPLGRWSATWHDRSNSVRVLGH